MRSFLVFIFLISVLGRISAQEEAHPAKKKIEFYPSLSVLTSFPTGEFKSVYPKSAYWGFILDGVFIPIKKYPTWQPGAEIEISLTTMDKDNWRGIEINSSGAFMKLNLVNRFRIYKEGIIDPFVEMVFGFNWSSTSTTYQIVDEATFFEEFFLGIEDEVQIVTVKEHDDFAMNVGIGAGVFIADIGMVMIKFNYSPEIEYVTKENIIVANDELTYQPASTKITTVSLALGVSMEKLFNAVKQANR